MGMRGACTAVRATWFRASRKCAAQRVRNHYTTDTQTHIHIHIHTHTLTAHDGGGPAYVYRGPRRPGRDLELDNGATRTLINMPTTLRVRGAMTNTGVGASASSYF
jgi:hypothetical protein